MKRVIKLLLVLVIVGISLPAFAWNWYPLGVAEMAGHGGATHMAVFKSTDFSASTTSNTALLVTNSIPASCSVEIVAMVLDTPFSVGTTNYTDSCLLTIGDGSDGDYFMSSTELASDGTEVIVQFGRPTGYTLVSTPTATTTNLVYLDASTNATTNAVVTGVSVASVATPAELGRKLYATAGSLVFTFTPDANQALSAFVAGEVRVYFRLFQLGR